VDADIKKMFNHLQVAEGKQSANHFDYLRLSRISVSFGYQMNVYVFGSTSSPIIYI
jgi:hypothetical protein